MTTRYSGITTVQCLAFLVGSLIVGGLVLSVITAGGDEPLLPKPKPVGRFVEKERQTLDPTSSFVVYEDSVTKREILLYNGGREAAMVVLPSTEPAVEKSERE